jgi:hypothetical protein
VSQHTTKADNFLEKAKLQAEKRLKAVTMTARESKNSTIQPVKQKGISLTNLSNHADLESKSAIS